MLAETLINHSIPALRPSDTVGKALDLMQDFKISQLVYVDNEQVKAIFDEDNLLNWQDDSVTLEELPLENKAVNGHIYQHIQELAGLAVDKSSQIIPILDEDNFYSGSVVVSEMLREFSKLMNNQEVGAIVVIKINQINYSLAEISRLVESNNIKIINSYFSTSPLGVDSDSTLTLKLNKTDVSAAIATLERFGYSIEGVYGHTPVESIDQHRLNHLLRYLEV